MHRHVACGPGAAAMGANHIGFGPDFVIDEDKTRRIKLSLMPFPVGAATHHVRPT
jgi:hypothetical protein